MYTTVDKREKTHPTLGPKADHIGFKDLRVRARVYEKRV